MTSDNDWTLPERLNKADGTVRRLGVEIELQGIAVGDLATLVGNAIGGDIHAVSTAEYRVEVEGQGDYRVEVDFELLKEMAAARSEDPSGDAFKDLLVDALSAASSLVVPCEIISPPLPLDAASAPLEAIVDTVRDAGGTGTRRSPWYAFGLHLNVEPADLEAATIGRYLRAYVCLYDWIVWSESVDISRRITPYIAAFPRQYELLVTAEDYAPDWPTLIDDYLDHNATRNRGLDMLPMLTHVDEDRVLARVDDSLIKPRPAFHYRLANSLVDDPDWSIRLPWERWMTIESLASDAERLDDCCRAFQRSRERILHGVDSRWREEVKAWLSP